MNRENIRTIGFVLLFVALVALVICFDDIKTILDEAMMGQADSLVDQLLR